MFCAAFLVGILAPPLVHAHSAVQHQHGAQEQHRHESLLHAHVTERGDSDADPHVDTGDHGHDGVTAIDLPCCLVRSKVISAAPRIAAAVLQASVDPAHGSILDLTPVSHPRSALYLIGPGLRGPPA